jgi:hypothetical protein
MHLKRAIANRRQVVSKLCCPQMTLLSTFVFPPLLVGFDEFAGPIGIDGGNKVFLLHLPYRTAIMVSVSVREPKGGPQP